MQAQALDGVGSCFSHPIAAGPGARFKRAQRQGRVPVDGKSFVGASDRVEHDQVVLRRRCGSFNHRLAGTSQRADFLVDIGPQLHQLGRPLRGAGKGAGNDCYLRMHPALEVQSANADAARLDQQTDSVFEAKHIATRVGLRAAHGYFPVSRIA